MSLPIRSQVFGLIRRHDVELAETYFRLCPDVQTVPELNSFFRMTLTQHNVDTLQERTLLDDTMDLSQWLRHFERGILPTLRRLRFPPITGKDVPDFYGNPNFSGLSIA